MENITGNDIDECEITKGKADIIQAINRDTVHRICSGQVVLTLAIAVKELVENAIDAGATNIDIRIKNYGIDLVEVTDNGSGVRRENFAALTLKHYTSKIRAFSDLESVCTLGFRGEALSSLCSLATLSIVTKHASAEYGTKIFYDKNGLIEKEIPSARPIGTTVTLEDLFNTLPVRRKEFVKNSKKEFVKMCTLLYAYCLVSKGIKFSCSNVTTNGSKSQVFTTQGLNTIKDNIVSIFGSKQISSLIEIELAQPDEEIAQEYSLKLDSTESSPFKFEFFISSVVHGNGRSATDRQFYFINSRPCEPTKIIKLVNEIYRQFNSNQYPFVYLNIILETNMVDVNVTPDKRQIFLEKEKLLLATVKATLLESFKKFPSTYKLQNVNKFDNILSPQNDIAQRGFKRSIESLVAKNKLSMFESSKKRSKNEIKNRNDCESKKQLSLLNLTSFKINNEPNGDTNLDILVEEADNQLNIIKNEADETQIEEFTSCKLEPEKISTDQKLETASDDSYIQLEVAKITDIYRKKRKTIEIDISLDDIRSSLKQCDIKEDASEICVKFRSKIEQSSNVLAEEELQKQISKDMFNKMNVIGQFNYAFIITSLDNDLFIIDQHATDEKYNFEELQRNTVLDSQPLVRPQDLQLTAGQENILIEHESIFKKNGFYFTIDHNAEATKKVKLIKIPVSKSYLFGKDDIDEMLYMLQEGYETKCRPTRIRGMFASRACRKSVMVGKPLANNDMKRLVDHMGEIDQPWNCPHGRPTMRHLVNLGLLYKE